MMEISWLKQGDAEGVIVVFGGWALGASDLVHLKGAPDLLFVDDYRELGDLPDLSGYKHRTAVAYSFGVAAFAHLSNAQRDQFDRTVAINGSPAPVDRKLGIPPMIYDKTQLGLSQDQFRTFLTLCHGAPQATLQIDVPDRREELNAVKLRGPAPCPAFDRIWISSQDRIFPAGNLRRVFADQTDKIRSLDAPHVPFAQWTTWQEILA